MVHNQTRNQHYLKNNKCYFVIAKQLCILWEKYNISDLKIQESLQMEPIKY